MPAAVDDSPMSHHELLPIPPVETATDPVYSAADLCQRWRALMGPLGFGERLLWFGFVGRPGVVEAAGGNGRAIRRAA